MTPRAHVLVEVPVAGLVPSYVTVGALAVAFLGTPGPLRALSALRLRLPRCGAPFAEVCAADDGATPCAACYALPATPRGTLGGLARTSKGG